MSNRDKNRHNSIQNQKNAGTNGFGSNPQNINKKGRPRILIADTINKLKEMGVSETNAVEIKAVYLRLINLTDEELAEMSKDPNQSRLVRVVAENLLGGKGFEILQTMLDRAIGKSEANVKVQTNVIEVFVPEDSKFDEADSKND